MMESYFAKLQLDKVREIASDITNILYDSLTEKTAVNKSSRLNALLLLRRWGKINTGHLNINLTNYDCIVDCLLDVLTMSENEQDLYVTNNPDIISSVVEYYDKLNKRYEDNIKLLEIIQKSDKNKCNNESILDFRNISKKKPFLLSFLNEHASEENTKCDIVPSSKTYTQACLGYALLNLKWTAADSKLITVILKNMGTDDCEIKFANYLWQHNEKLRVTEDILILLFERFKFLYEKELIKICTEELKGNIPNEITDDFKKMLKFCLKNKTIRCNIKSLLYELYAYSRYNNKLYRFLEIDSLVQ